MRTFKFGPYSITSNEIFFTSKHSIGFVNLKPVVPGHVLVISKRVVPRFSLLSKEETSDFFQTVHTISQQIESHYAAESLTLTIQDGPKAGQTVPHIHLHIIPRREGDWMSNDDIYPEINSKERELKVELEKRQQGPDSDRKPRTPQEMGLEASILRRLFKKEENFEDIWLEGGEAKI